MLSANKVKLHGMSDPRWTVKDKIVQYKGLINLFKRDNKLLRSDFINLRKQKIRTINELTNSIDKSRKQLEAAVNGDKQALRNALQDQKLLQLASVNLPAERVVENIHQINFNQRKELDRLKYRMLSRCAKMAERKLNLAYLEDREERSQSDREVPLAVLAQAITGKVQDALLKQEAAIAVGYIYKQLLDLLKKDTYYYDAVLATLRSDLVNQTKCLRRATELGQLATEYLDDRRYDLVQQEGHIKRDRTRMLQSIDDIKERFKSVSANIKILIRRDSDVNIPTRNRIVKTDDEERLFADVAELETILATLRESVFVPNFDAIYPCLQTQRRTADNLTTFVDRLNEAHDMLTNKKNHAQVRLNALRYTMIERTLIYMERKRKLRAVIERVRAERDVIRAEITKRGEMALRIRACLNDIDFALRPIATQSKLSSVSTARVLFHEAPSDQGSISEAELFKLIKLKLATILGQYSASQMSESQRDAAYSLYNELMERYTYKHDTTTHVTEEALIEFMMVDSAIHTRESLKAESARIVQECNVDPDLIYKPPKKRR